MAAARPRKLRRQVDALTAAGCHRIFEEKLSGKNTDRPELANPLEAEQRPEAAATSKAPQPASEPVPTGRGQACPTCDYRPTDSRELELHRDGLATIWLTLDSDHPGQVIERRHCERCQPHRARIVMGGLFDTTVMLGDDLAVPEAFPSPNRWPRGSRRTAGVSTTATGTAASTPRPRCRTHSHAAIRTPRTRLLPAHQRDGTLAVSAHGSAPPSRRPGSASPAAKALPF